MAETDVPPYYLCPISLHIMTDPVIIFTGITYDRDSIEKWFFTHRRTTCPVTNQHLPAAAPDLLLTPNLTLRRLIHSWSALHSADPHPTPKPPAPESQISELLAAAASTSPAQIESEFFSELAQILGDESVCQNASKAALKILLRVCPWGRNRARAVEAGLVPVLIDLLLDSTDKRAVEMILAVLDVLCQCADGRSELIAHAAGLAVVAKRILRVSNAASESAVRILHSVSRFSATAAVVQEMMQTGVVAKLCLVAQVECGVKTKERVKGDSQGAREGVEGRHVYTDQFGFFVPDLIIDDRWM